MSDLLKQYQKLKEDAVSSAAAVTRAEERVEVAREQAKAAFAVAKSHGFTSLAEVQDRRAELEQAIDKALNNLKETVA